MGQFKMPSLGADMESGTITKWLVGPGDPVQRGDVIAVVDTEKSTIEVEVFESGVVDRILVAEGAEVPVGTPLASIAAAVPAGAPAPEAVAAVAPAAAPAIASEAVAAVAPAAAPPEWGASRPEMGREAPHLAGDGGGRPAEPRPAEPRPAEPRPAVVASPVVRRLARRLGVDVAGVRGSAPGGRVTRHDVETAAARGTTFRRSSPLARRRAAALGVDLTAVAGTGPGGAVTATDVECAPARSEQEPARPPAAVPPGSVPAAGPTGAGDGTAAGDRQAAMRRAIGALMARSKREIPHYYLSATADLSATEEWLARTNLDRAPADRLVMPVLMIRAVARAVAAVPEMNGFMVDGAFRPSPEVHVGVAVSLRQGGLIAPAIHDCDRLSLDDLMGALRDLVGRARAGRLRSSEMSDPTITVTNLGDQGVESVFGVIYPPQVALVGFGKVVEKPWAEAGMVGVRPCTTVTLSADHRASDGHRGGRFLARVVELLQHPEDL